VLFSPLKCLLGLLFMEGRGSQRGCRLVNVLSAAIMGGAAFFGAVSDSHLHNLPGAGGVGVLCTACGPVDGCS